MFEFRPSVVAARKLLEVGRRGVAEAHAAGAPGVQTCARMTEVYEAVVRAIADAAFEALPEGRRLAESVALVAHGGFGRREVAPYSDVDLMILHAPHVAPLVAPLARRITQDLFDVGLTYGGSVRTPAQARRLALEDASIFTSLIESRFLVGSDSLFERFFRGFRAAATWRPARLAQEIEASREDERRKFGETVFLLEPNIKRSPGGLRDYQLLRWVAFARHGQSDPAALLRLGALSQRDGGRLLSAREFLLRLRNDLHLAAGKSQDVLQRNEQLRLAKERAYAEQAGQLPVERFMKEFFAYTSDIREVSEHLVAGARRRRRAIGAFARAMSHRVDGKFLVGPHQIRLTRSGRKATGELEHVLRLVELANMFDKRIEHGAWDAVREKMELLCGHAPSPDAVARFWALIEQPTRLASLLTRLHELRVLERLVPPLAHARSLVQFNSYHKFTVDEHCLRTVQAATEFLDDDGPVGSAYRGIGDKRILHLACLLHDLGKGLPGDHSEVGKELAADTARHLGLGSETSETLQFLVHKHLMMTHLAFRRDLNDESTIIQFAAEVGSPERLRLLFVLSCADLAAVGPETLSPWKVNVLAHLFLRTMRRLLGDSPSLDAHDAGRRCRRQALLLIENDPDTAWFRRRIEALPPMYLDGATPEAVIDDLRRIKAVPEGASIAWGRYAPERGAAEYTLCASEQARPGMFARLTGALAKSRCQILGAEINTLETGHVLDRFLAVDLNFRGAPPDARLAEVAAALMQAAESQDDGPIRLPQVWSDPLADSTRFAKMPTRVRFDNSSSPQYTIIDIFSHDRLGLLYDIARALAECGVSISVAKISTHLDQVVDVFYVTKDGRKLEGAGTLEALRARLIQAIGESSSETSEG